jgi:uncharacterized membrane protein YphA (DoxX/SURF4 family)
MSGGETARGDREPAPVPVPRRALLLLMIGSLAAGVALMVPFEATITRVLGVIALFTFIISGVFLIADPAWLDREPD